MRHRQDAWVLMIGLAILSLGWHPAGAEEAVRPSGLPTKVTFREDHTFLVNGRPFFPIGLYYAQEEIADSTGTGLAELKAMGFNYIVYTGDPKLDQLDGIARAGLFVQYDPLGGLCREHEKLPKFVEAVRNHPALLMWEVADEPTLNKVNYEETKKGCAILRKLDPDHPILVTHDTYVNAEDLRRWGAICDINGFDFYPVPLRHWWYGTMGLPLVSFWDAHSIGIMGRLTEAWQKAVPERPVLPVLQAWSWNVLAYGEDAYPTPKQGRFMAYQVIISGAKAISFYGKVRTSSEASARIILPPEIAEDKAKIAASWEKGRDLNHRFWEGFKPVIRELGDMAPVFAAPDADWQPTMKSSGLFGGMNRSIETRVKQLDESTWVILLVNNSNSRSRIQIGLPRIQADKPVYSWQAGQPLGADKSGLFTDQLDSFGVRVYSNKPRDGALATAKAAPGKAEKK